MAYIWSYLRRYPKWLAMNFTAAILFVIANLGLPTVLARMIDEGINRGDADKLYTLCLGHVRCGLDWDCWSCRSCPMRLVN
ncbi:MAG: hypothetical protein ACLTYH_01850 [Streptococcus salivarius]